MTHAHHELRAFDDFTLDLTRGFLYRGAQELKLRPKSFEILRYLVANSGRLVTKAELMQAVWPNVVVTDDSLVQCMKEVRQALSDESHRIIQTVARRGYIFNSEVRELNRPSPPDSPAERGSIASSDGDSAFSGAATTDRNQLTGRRVWTVLAVVLVAALGYQGVFDGWLGSRVPAVRSIAVLPFQLLTAAGNDDDYLGLGMTDMLITRLSSTGEILVRPTSAVLKYESGKNGLAAGDELGVESVLEGHVQHVGDRVRVTAKLFRVKDGRALWAGKFDEPFTNLFAVQDSIAQQVADSLTLRLSDQKQRLLTRRDTTSGEAYQAYLKGRFFWNKRTEEGLTKAIRYFQQAIDADPGYALAYAGLADSYALMGAYSGFPAKEAFPRAKAAAMRALAIDENLAEAHISLAFVKAHYDYDWAGAEHDYRRALALNANYATAHQWYALLLVAKGRFEEAIEEARQGLAVDPLSLIIGTDLGRHFYYARRYDQAIEQFRKTIDLDPSFTRVHVELARSFKHQRLYAEAAAELENALTLVPGAVTALAELASTYASAGRIGEARRILADLRERSKRHYVSPYHFAVIYAALGEAEAAVSALEMALDERFNWVVFIAVEPNFDGLRQHPRFATLAQRLGLELGDAK